MTSKKYICRMRKLEASIHQFNGNKEKAYNWARRINKDLDVSVIERMYLGQFLYYTGNNLEILPNSTRSYTFAKDDE